MKTARGRYDHVVTHSGRMVSPTEGSPSAEDLALSLSRQPRFGGMCRRHWTVLDHSIFTAMLAKKDGQSPEVQLACLLHDAHEWTGDIPTHFKHHGQRQLQREQDWRIFGELFPSFGDGNVTSQFYNEVKEYDRRSLLAEARIVGPPIFNDPKKVEEHFGEYPLLRDSVVLLKSLQEDELGVSSSEIDFGLDARNVRKFLNLLTALRAAVKERREYPVRTTPAGFIANEARG
jgi:hypothetical protein